MCGGLGEEMGGGECGGGGVGGVREMLEEGEVWEELTRATRKGARDDG